MPTAYLLIGITVDHVPLLRGERPVLRRIEREAPQICEYPFAASSAPYGLRAVAGAENVTLSWKGAPGATSNNIYRGASAGTETLYQAGVATPGFIDNQAANGVTFFYVVTAVNAAGAPPLPAAACPKRLPGSRRWDCEGRRALTRGARSE
jgi:hypothetical protein